MNPRTPWWPLLRNEIGVDHAPKVQWVLGAGLSLACWLVCSFVPFLLLFRVSEGDITTFFTSFDELASFALAFWLSLSGCLFTFALIPGLSNRSQVPQSFEFLFTRAIDRRTLFRARAGVIHAAMLGPLLINLLVSTAAPPVTLRGDSNDPVLTARRGQYLRVFPHPQIDETTPKQIARLVIPRGAVLMTAWIAWMGFLALLLMQGFCIWLAGCLRHNPWLAGLAMAVPAVATFSKTFWDIGYPYRSQVYEQIFLFFSGNLVPLLLATAVLAVVVQVFSERRFRDLEIY